MGATGSGGEGSRRGHGLSPDGPLPCGSEGPRCQLFLRLSFPVFDISFLDSDSVNLWLLHLG